MEVKIVLKRPVPDGLQPVKTVSNEYVCPQYARTMQGFLCIVDMEQVQKLLSDADPHTWFIFNRTNGKKVAIRADNIGYIDEQ
jgi:hypothetical protein